MRQASEIEAGGAGKQRVASKPDGGEKANSTLVGERAASKRDGDGNRGQAGSRRLRARGQASKEHAAQASDIETGGQARGNGSGKRDEGVEGRESKSTQPQKQVQLADSASGHL